MHLIYYDEVKYDPPTQGSYWLGGICVSNEIVPELEQAVNSIAHSAFGDATLNRDTEFHGIEICRGKGNFKGRSIAERLAILNAILEILARDDVMRLYVRIIPENIVYSNKPTDEIAFMYFVEKADSLLRSCGTFGMLFGDYDEPMIGSSVASLSQFREGGTSWERGRDIDNIVDTVHFARSHHSRMIQLADVFLYCLQFVAQPNNSGWRKSFAEVIEQSGIKSCRRVRVWPTEPVWYR